MNLMGEMHLHGMPVLSYFFLLALCDQFMGFSSEIN
jgi:hypothetical protein